MIDKIIKVGYAIIATPIKYCPKISEGFCQQARRKTQLCRRKARMTTQHDGEISAEMRQYLIGGATK